ncbi:hypothetical protein CHL78_009500 [Romboutsia weinsteinii]|uniref:Polysaccharide biosynthesis protein n=1 Tax=Romboutsia weinsteinii TaxID=2020949 RepID=A0A371J3T7_9FIRM|nr:oligosaccharide flippase family protein [Romboutsia weinsteinii]RDY27439.1 hypothetical protein CHL78_009500 [Romboutsia weinsteinii]
MQIIKKNSYIINTIFNYIYKILSMAITYITIPLTLSYLDNERYGIWQTILTIISWASLSNFGIGNGLRNKVTESLTEKKYEKLKSYITSAYLYITTISTIILIISIILVCTIDTNVLFKENSLSQDEIILSFIIVIISFCLNFILGISNSIAFGIHKSSIVNLFQIIANIITLIGLILLPKFTQASLINISLLYLIANTFSNIIFTIYIFSDKKLRPNIKYKSKKYGIELTSLGLEFFVLQISTIILFSTDNFIISTFIGVNEVTDYSLISKLFQIVSTFFSILLVQLWSEVARSTHNEEYSWIKKSMNRLIILLIPVAIILSIIVIKFDTLIKIWIGKSIVVDKRLILLAAFYAWLICFNGIFVNIQNGMSKIRIQTISSIISCILNIPIAIILIKVFNLGVLGVMLSNIICLSISSVMCSVDVIYNINRRIEGIQNNSKNSG